MTVDPERARRAADSRRSRVDERRWKQHSGTADRTAHRPVAGNAINPVAPLRASAARNGPLVSFHIHDARTESRSMRSRSGTR